MNHASRVGETTVTSKHKKLVPSHVVAPNPKLTTAEPQFQKFLFPYVLKTCKHQQELGPPRQKLQFSCLHTAVPATPEFLVLDESQNDQFLSCRPTPHKSCEFLWFITIYFVRSKRPFQFNLFLWRCHARPKYIPCTQEMFRRSHPSFCFSPFQQKSLPVDIYSQRGQHS